MKDILKNILVQNQERRPLEYLKHRNTGISLVLNKIQAIIGPRRVGKTSAMLLAIDELITKKGVSQKKHYLL